MRNYILLTVTLFLGILSPAIHAAASPLPERRTPEEIEHLMEWATQNTVRSISENNSHDLDYYLNNFRDLHQYSLLNIQENPSLFRKFSTGGTSGFSVFGLLCALLILIPSVIGFYLVMKNLVPALGPGSGLNNAIAVGLSFIGIMGIVAISMSTTFIIDQIIATRLWQTHDLKAVKNSKPFSQFWVALANQGIPNPPDFLSSDMQAEWIKSSWKNKPTGLLLIGGSYPFRTSRKADLKFGKQIAKIRDEIVLQNLEAALSNLPEKSPALQLGKEVLKRIKDKGRSSLSHWKDFEFLERELREFERINEVHSIETQTGISAPTIFDVPMTEILANKVPDSWLTRCRSGFETLAKRIRGSAR